MSKPDSMLKHDVVAALEWDPSVTGPTIGAVVKGGAVTLTGTLHTDAEERAAPCAESPASLSRMLEDAMRCRALHELAVG